MAQTILELDPAATEAKAHESEITPSLINFQISVLQNCEEKNIVVLNHYILKHFVTKYSRLTLKPAKHTYTVISVFIYDLKCFWLQLFFW